MGRRPTDGRGDESSGAGPAVAVSFHPELNEIGLRLASDLWNQFVLPTLRFRHGESILTEISIDLVD